MFKKNQNSAGIEPSSFEINLTTDKKLLVNCGKFYGFQNFQVSKQVFKIKMSKKRTEKYNNVQENIGKCWNVQRDFRKYRDMQAFFEMYGDITLGNKLSYTWSQ